jgi:hypothetical protein
MIQRSKLAYEVQSRGTACVSTVTDREDQSGPVALNNLTETEC